MIVSVIIPTFNSAKYLVSAINSVLAQTYSNFEILIIDDGSTDDTREILKTYTDSRIQYFYQQNAGPAAARNKGINLAKGDLIAFLDADDVWEKDKLSTQIKIFSQNNDICMVYNSFVFKPGENKKEKLVRFKNLTRLDFIKYLLIDPFNTIPYPSTVMVKKSYFDKAGLFDSELRSGEDWDLWLRLANIGECYYIDKALTRRFTPKTSITRSMNPEHEILYHEKILRRFFDNNHSFLRLKSQALSLIFCNHGMNYFYKNDKTPSMKVYSNIAKSLKTDPRVILTNPKKIRFFLNLIFRSLIVKFK